jgi:protein ImuB
MSEDRARRIGCLHVPDFVVAAAVRAEPTLRGRAVAILSEPAPARIVIGANRAARGHGVHPGMTEAEVLARPREVVCRPRVPEQEHAAQRALLEVALAHSPRVELGGAGLLYLDVTGLGGLYGDEPAIGRRLREGAAAVGLDSRVGIAGSRAAARLAARWGRGVQIVPAGEEARHLARAPLALLDLDAGTHAIFERWGVRTLGELAALPTPDLFERLGARGPRLQALARGEDPRPLRPQAPPERFEETAELDCGLETIEPVVAILGDLAERLCARLARRALLAHAVEWRCRGDDGRVHDGRVSPAVPTREPAAVTALCRVSLEARPPRRAVTAITLRLHPTRGPLTQGLLGAGARPDPRLIGQVLASLADLVGLDHLGVPVLLDSHRPDAVRLDPLPLAADAAAPAPAGAAPDGVTTGGAPAGGAIAGGATAGGGARGVRPALALRRLRPPRPAAVSMSGGRPVELRAEPASGRIVASAGPWRTSGEWWGEDRWALDEWDVELESGALCRIATDGRSWSLHGVYD